MNNRADLLKRIKEIDPVAEHWLVENEYTYKDLYGAMNLHSSYLCTSFYFLDTPRGVYYWYAIAQQLGEEE